MGTRCRKAGLVAKGTRCQKNVVVLVAQKTGWDSLPKESWDSLPKEVWHSFSREKESWTHCQLGLVAKGKSYKRYSCCWCNKHSQLLQCPCLPCPCFVVVVVGMKWKRKRKPRKLKQPKQPKAEAAESWIHGGESSDCDSQELLAHKKHGITRSYTAGLLRHSTLRNFWRSTCFLLSLRYLTSYINLFLLSFRSQNLRPYRPKIFALVVFFLSTYFAFVGPCAQTFDTTATATSVVVILYWPIKKQSHSMKKSVKPLEIDLRTHTFSAHHVLLASTVVKFSASGEKRVGNLRF